MKTSGIWSPFIWYAIEGVIVARRTRRFAPELTTQWPFLGADAGSRTGPYASALPAASPKASGPITRAAAHATSPNLPGDAVSTIGKLGSSAGASERNT